MDPNSPTLILAGSLLFIFIQLELVQKERASIDAVDAGIAGPTLEEVSDDEQLLCNFYTHVVAVTVKSITSEAPYTNATPANVRIHVINQLKGALGSDEISASWGPVPFNPDSHGTEEAWRRLPLPAPDVGTRWIVAGERKNGGFVVSLRCLYPCTDKTQRQVRFVLDHYPAWAAGLGRHDSQAEAAAYDREVEVEREADIEKLCESSTDIVVGTPMSVTPYLGSYVLWVYDCDRLLDSRPPESREPKSCVRVDALYEARHMVQFRWPKMVRHESPAIVFMKTSTHDSIDLLEQSKARTDSRTFRFADTVNGLVRATPERIEQIKSILAKRATSK